MLVVSYYTGDGNYAAYAAKLRASCEKFGIGHQIDQLPTRGAWVKNLGFKPQFVYEKLLKNRRSIIWCDADCEILQHPTLLEDESFDLMIYNWYAEPNPGARVYDPARLGPAGGVFKVAYGAPGLQLMRHWADGCKKYHQLRDDMVLGHVYEQWRGPKLKTFWLPKAYNRMDSHWPDVPPVINHVYTDGSIFSENAQAPARREGLPIQQIDPTAPRHS